MKQYLVHTFTLPADYFHLAATLDCGQAFRWNEYEDGYFGVAGDRPLLILPGGDGLTLHCQSKEDEAYFKHYFDMDFDYEKLIAENQHDPYISAGVSYAYGQRLLLQEHFEALLSFIISANNNLKRIKGIIQRICESYGSEILPGVFAFPTPQQLIDVSEDDYKNLGAGYRAAYLHDTVQKINDGFDLSEIESLPYPAAKERLMQLKGVGGKVADCVLLYGYCFRQAFPLDVHVQRIVKGLYFKGKKLSIKQMEDFAAKTLGEHAGVLQLFLFHYARHHKGDIDSGA